MSSIDLTPAQKAAITRQRKKFAKELAEKQELLRNNPKLMAEIAKRIREDQHANENPVNYTNGTMHWYQQQWGQVRFDKKVLKEFQSSFGFSAFEVTCPTTGCVAGWATTLAGYPMVIRAIIDTYDNSPIHQDGEIVDVNECNVNGKIRDIPMTAADLLNLGVGDRSWLFDAYRHEEQVLWALDQIADKGFLIYRDCPFNDDGVLYEEINSHGDYIVN